MARRPKPPELHLIDGTARSDRPTRRVVPQLEGDPEPPEWMPKRAREIWERKVAVYRERGQSVVGCEDTLAQYCMLEAKIIGYYRANKMPTASLIAQHRIWAAEFYDTPASQVRTGKGGPNNSGGGGDPAGKYRL